MARGRPLLMLLLVVATCSVQRSTGDLVLVRAAVPAAIAPKSKTAAVLEWVTAAVYGSGSTDGGSSSSSPAVAVAPAATPAAAAAASAAVTIQAPRLASVGGGTSCACPKIYAPVCGTDGSIHASSCMASCAGVAVAADKAINWEGKCVTAPAGAEAPAAAAAGPRRMWPAPAATAAAGALPTVDAGGCRRCECAEQQQQQQQQQGVTWSPSQCGQGWWGAPGCSAGAQQQATDKQGCPWGWEDSRSCALRQQQGSASASSGGRGGSGSGGSQQQQGAGTAGARPPPSPPSPPPQPSPPAAVSSSAARAGPAPTSHPSPTPAPVPSPTAPAAAGVSTATAPADHAGAAASAGSNGTATSLPPSAAPSAKSPPAGSSNSTSPPPSPAAAASTAALGSSSSTGTTGAGAGGDEGSGGSSSSSEEDPGEPMNPDDADKARRLCECGPPGAREVVCGGLPRSGLDKDRRRTYASACIAKCMGVKFITDGACP